MDKFTKLSVYLKCTRGGQLYSVRCKTNKGNIQYTTLSDHSVIYRASSVDPGLPGGAVVFRPYYDSFQGKPPAIVIGLGVVEDIIPIG